MSGVGVKREACDPGYDGEIGYGVFMKNSIAQENFEMISG